MFALLAAVVPRASRRLAATLLRARATELRLAQIRAVLTGRGAGLHGAVAVIAELEALAARLDS